jgi:hypothetical protein
MHKIRHMMQCSMALTANKGKIFEAKMQVKASKELY